LKKLQVDLIACQAGTAKKKNNKKRLKKCYSFGGNCEISFRMPVCVCTFQMNFIVCCEIEK